MIIIAMTIEWKVVAGMTRASAAHSFHGLCNSGVGRPYEEFLHELRRLSDSGDTDALARVLRRAEEGSRDIYDVWLAEKPDAYRESIRKVLK